MSRIAFTAAAAHVATVGIQLRYTCLEAGVNVPSALLHDPGELTEKS